MKNSTGIKRYHLTVITLYAFLAPLLIYLFGKNLRFDANGNMLLGTAIGIAAAATFLAFLSPRLGRTATLTPISVASALGYGFLFALPEEIIFRGVIQWALESRVGSDFGTVLLSSAIFGLAHVYNGAKGLGILKWNWKLAGLTFLAGWPLGATYALTHSLLIPILLHAFFVFYLKLTENEQK